MQSEDTEPAPLVSRRDRRKEKHKGGALQFLRELPVLIIVALGIALLIKTFVVQAFYIPSGSMENTLMIGDRVLVSKFLYRFSEPKSGQVIVFVSPFGETNPKVDRGTFRNFLNSIAEDLGLKSTEKDFIKRVIATEGQTIQAKQGAVFVNNRKLTEPYLHDSGPIPDYGPTKIPKGKVFVMGDNRNNSQDSRVFGPISKSTILGRAFVLIWPPSRIHLLGNPGG
ncbi:MAG: signal peptidase I [Actinomycetota bacterium]